MLLLTEINFIISPINLFLMKYVYLLYFKTNKYFSRVCHIDETCWNNIMSHSIIFHYKSQV